MFKAASAFQRQISARGWCSPSSCGFMTRTRCSASALHSTTYFARLKLIRHRSVFLSASDPVFLSASDFKATHSRPVKLLRSCVLATEWFVFSCPVFVHLGARLFLAPWEVGCSLAAPSLTGTVPRRSALT